MSLEKEESEDMKSMKALTQSIEDALILTSSKPSDAEVDDEMEGSADEEDGNEGDDDEVEDMENDNNKDNSDMTVVLSNKTSGQMKSKSVKTGEINEFNQQTNKSQKKEFKRKRKEQKKMGQAASVPVEERMADSEDEDYNFDTDLM